MLQMAIRWLDIGLDTPMREVGWTYVILVVLVIVIVVLVRQLTKGG